jgi:hypothetical protein
MKNFYEFLNEMHSISKFNRLEPLIPINFKFSINAWNSTKEEKIAAIQEFGKYFNMEDHICLYLLSDRYKNPVWNIDLYESWGNGGKERHSIRFETVNFMNSTMLLNDLNTITLKEFLKMGIEYVKEYINIKKYNL